MLLSYAFLSVFQVLLISDIKSEDIDQFFSSVCKFSFVSEEKGTFVLHHAKGSNAEQIDLQPIDENLQIGKSTYMTPIGGRSSDNTAFPFFNIELPGQQGIMVAVGWTGK